MSGVVLPAMLHRVEEQGGALVRPVEPSAALEHPQDFAPIAEVAPRQFPQRKALPHHYSETPHVACHGRLSFAKGLGRHPTGGQSAGCDLVVDAGVGVEPAPEPKVGDLGGAIGTNEDVAGGEVAVHAA